MLRLAAFALIVVATVLGVLGAILIVSGWVSGAISDIVEGALMVVVPLALFLFVRRLAVRQGHAAFVSALEGFAADHDAWYYGSGLAVSSIRQQVLVAGPSAHKVYPLSDFLGARNSFTGDVPYSSSGPLAGFMVIIGLVRIIIGYFTDGMFLQFRDGSAWQIAGLRKSDSKVWAERLAAGSLSEVAAPDPASIVTSR